MMQLVSFLLSSKNYALKPNQYITWITDNKPAWTIKAGGMAADSRVDISARPVPQEPMVMYFKKTFVCMVMAHNGL